MKISSYLSIFIICFLVSNKLFSQTKTEESKTVLNSDGSSSVVKSTSVTSSEDITPRNNLISINPLKFFLFYNATYYRKLNNTIVVGAGFQIPTLKDVGGFGINAELRLHPLGKALSGVYLAPNVSYNSLSSKQNSFTTSATSIGALLGWQWFPGEQFAMGLGIGMDYYMLSSNDNDVNSFYSSFQGSSPALRFDIGFGW